jgi:hypothetical protein
VRCSLGTCIELRNSRLYPLRGLILGGCGDGGVIGKSQRGMGENNSRLGPIRRVNLQVQGDREPVFDELWLGIY